MSKNGIVVDLDKITRRDHTAWRNERYKMLRDEESTPEDVVQHDFEKLFSKVLVSWPYGDITFERYLDLPYAQSVEVDQAVFGPLDDLAQKK